MFVKDIVERPTSKPSEPGSAPQPPRPPVASKGGFPIVAHRSKGGSAFARARKDDATRRAGGLAVGEGRIVESVPVVQPEASSSAPPPSGPLSEAEEVRRSVSDENARRVAGMSATEREQEAEELKERFGGGVVELMQKRREARERAAASGAAGSSSASTSSSTPARPPAPAAIPPVEYKSTADLTDARKILESVDSENAAKVSSMSAAEVDEEVRELEGRFGAGLIAKLRARAKPRKEVKSEPMEVDTTSQKETKSEAMDVDTETKPSPPTDKAEKEKKAVRFDVEETTPASLKKYFADVPSEDAKLQWMQGGETPLAPSKLSSDPNAPRFDLSGAPLSSEASAALPTHLGLHHHGDQPDLAGYTLSEIIHLCYSTVASQRITMMGVLGRVIGRFVQTSPTDKDAWVVACREDNVVGKGVDVSCGVLGGHTRSIGVLVAAVDLLFTSLGGKDWHWMDADVDAVPIPFKPEPTREGEPTGVAAIPFPDLAPRLGEILALDPGSLPPTTFAQLLRILQRAALAAPEGAEAITSLLPPLLKTHVLRAPWPLDMNHPPNRIVLRLLRDVVTSSRAAAEALIAQNVFQPLLKFAASDIGTEPLSQALLLEVLRIFYALGRYGLHASVATGAREIWQSLGTWVSTQLASTAPTPETSAIIVAYFDLLRVWTVCAIDPHRTTPEHDLTWAQITALGWVDEELAAAKALLQTERWGELAAVLSALAEYVFGSGINGAKKGEAEKAAVLSALVDMDLVGSLPQGVDSLPTYATRDAFNTALAEVFRLHNLLRPASLLNSPERERLIWWFMATTQTSTADVYLRHAALEAARHDGVLDIAKWATSAFDLVLSCVAGDEPLALSIVDDLLRADWSKVGTEDTHDHGHGPHVPAPSKDLAAAVEAIGHKDGLQILRPLLHHAILPEIEGVLGSSRPSYLYLKASATLRPSPARTSGPGLPLPADWAFSPLDELLSSGSSSAFALAPSDWDAGETQLTRATLAFARIQAATARGPSRSLVILNAMKVFMLEHGQQDAPNTEQDVFRDAGVQSSLKELLGSVSEAHAEQPADETMDEDKDKDTAMAVPPAPLESASKRFLTPGVPFFQFYTDLVALYESVSFGDPLFARVLVPPLAMNYDVDYRKLVWADQPVSLRSMRIKAEDVPLETTLAAFYSPLETNKDVLLAQARALGGVVRRETSPFLFDVAVHHLAGLFFATDATERTSVRVQIMVVVLSSTPDPVVRAIVERDLETRGTVALEEREQRVAVMGELTGPRGVQRLTSVRF